MSHCSYLNWEAQAYDKMRVMQNMRLMLLEGVSSWLRLNTGHWLLHMNDNERTLELFTLLFHSIVVPRLFA